MLATTLGRHDDAERHFDAAMDSTTAACTPPLLAMAQGEYAAMLLARAGRGDEKRAANLRRRLDELGASIPL